MKVGEDDGVVSSVLRIIQLVKNHVWGGAEVFKEVYLGRWV